MLKHKKIFLNFHKLRKLAKQINSNLKEKEVNLQDIEKLQESVLIFIKKL